MSYKKFQANNIFTGTEMLDENHVLITDEKGKVKAIVDTSEAGEDVQMLDGIISPGFINSHCHLELSYLKGLIPEKTGLVDFVMFVMQKRDFPEEIILEAVKKGEEEMLQNGIVGVGDICNNAITLQQKQQNNLRYHNFIEVSGFIPQFAETRFEQAKKVYEQLSTVNCQLSIVPHAPYSVSKELFALINQHSAGKTISIHNQESAEENDFFINGESDFKRLYQQLNIDISFFKPTGKSSLQTFLPLLQSPLQLLLVHNTFTGEEDILMRNGKWEMGNSENHNNKLQSANHKPETFFCLCMNANQYIENKIPPIDLLKKNNCNIILGTDSLASNRSLNILDEIKTIIKYFPSVPQSEILQWATLNGAKALQMDDRLGSFEKGKQPGVICLSNDLTKVKRLI